MRRPARCQPALRSGFHQHLQYFSCRSIATLLESQTELIDFSQRAASGALLVAFRIGEMAAPMAPHNAQARLDPVRIRVLLALFRQQMAACADPGWNRYAPVRLWRRPMLPVLDYHSMARSAPLPGGDRRCA